MTFYEAPENQSQAPNREELLQLAICRAKAGNNKPARLMFEQVLKQDKNNERAMMWLAKIAEVESRAPRMADARVEREPQQRDCPRCAQADGVQTQRQR